MNKRTYNAKILPLVKEIKEICMNEKIPFFACFFTGASETTEKEIECLSPNTLDIKMPDNVFYNCINAINGFETIPPHKTIEIDLDFDLPG